MDEQHSTQEPLLPHVPTNQKAFFLLLSPLKLILKIVIWLLFIAWLTFIFAYPLDSGNDLVKKWSEYTTGTFLGVEGAAFLVFSCPILIIAFLSLPYIFISRKEQSVEADKIKEPKRSSYQLWTFPLLVNARFGVITAAELIGIIFFALYLIWAICVYAFREISLFNEVGFNSYTANINFILEVSALYLSFIGIFCLAFLFIPIARGSILLRLIDIPFGHAVRYHVWLGHITMLLFTLHGLFYIIAWSIEGSLLQNILKWQSTDVANLAGVIGLSAGLLMWVTSIPIVRKKYFEVFFYTHQLYIIFVIFLALHVSVVFFSIVAGSVFLFMLDRFLRFCQSRKAAHVVSATCFPSGIVQLLILKPQNLRYNALSFIFLQVGEISWLQWHPFSISSSSLGGENHLSVLIKVLGGWTTTLQDNFSTISGAKPQERLNFQSHNSNHKITACVEGPYGHEFPHHLMYEKLVLVAGGIGISPFLAVLSDIFQCAKQEKPCPVKSILLVWAIKRSNELPLLSTIDMKSMNPNNSNELNLEILINVTREIAETPVEEGKAEMAIDSSVWRPTFSVSNGSTISQLVGTGDNMWFGIYLITTTLGFLILVSLLNILYINPYSIPIGWYQGLLFVACMVASVCIFGGFVVSLWRLWEAKCSADNQCGEDGKRSEMISEHTGNDDPAAGDKSFYELFSNSTTIRYGSRPNFKEIFESIWENWGNVDVGVIVCGPPTLESSVAKECRSLNLSLMTQQTTRHRPVFHFHNHSFTL